MKDDQLIHLLKHSPSAGLEAAIAAYGGLVKRIAMNIIGNKQEDLEECVSDTFVRLWRNIDRFDQQRDIPLKSYLSGIARHTALDYRRKLKRTDDVIPWEECEMDFAIADNGTDVSAQVSERINAGMVQSAINQLPSPDKEIFIYRYYFYEKVADIAMHLALDQKTVENRLYRGKKKLKDILLKGGIIL